MDKNTEQRVQDKLAAYLIELIELEGFMSSGVIDFKVEGRITLDRTRRTYWLDSEHNLMRR